MKSNDRANIVVKQPRSSAERVAVAERCCAALELTMPLLVDTIDDRVGSIYSGMPDRLYVIDRDGRVAYKSGRGPIGFKPREMEQSLILLLLDQKTGTGGVPLPVASDAEAWKCLPRADKGAGQPLPAWARVLARALPRTTAAMLELDYLQRTRSPLDPKLRARMRWVAAHANRCAYSEAYAAADLRRAGVDDAGIRALARGDAKLPRPEEVALEFARKMTVAANTVTDAEVGQLVRLYGQKQVVAMVLLLAYANFQDRFILSLNVPLETGGPLKPLEVRFARKEAGRQQAAAPKRRPPAGKTIFSTKPAADREWTSLDFAQLQKAIEEQRARQPRIAVPSWEDVRKHLPPGYPKDRPLRIRWSLVCLGYQPELAAGWSACMRAFGQESRQDRAFEESVFWVITRSLQCFY